MTYERSSVVRFCDAITRGDAVALKELMGDPLVYPSSGGNWAIRGAAERGHMTVVQMLLEDPRIDPSDLNNATIGAAAKYGHAEVVRLLLTDPRVDPSADNDYAIRWACRMHVETTRVLLLDPRVNPFGAISWASPACARVLAAHSRRGIVQHRDLYATFHPKLTQEYDDMIARCVTMAWVAKQLCTWSDIVQPLEERWRAGFFE